jgi:KDO2-lipid IV(A) lauroyltransferase
LRFLLLIARLPIFIWYGFAWLLYVVAYYILGYRYEVVKSNLQFAFPEKSDQEIKRISKEFYRYLAEWMVEILKLPTFSEDTIKKRCHITPNEAFEQLKMEANGAIILTAHLGNWEWAGQRMGLALKQPVNVVYKQLSSNTMNRLMKHVRTSFGNEVSSMSEISRKLLESHNRGLVSCYLADQSPTRKQAGYWPTFLNRPAPFFTGPAKAAIKLNLPVYYGHIARVSKGYYQITLHQIAANPGQWDATAITEQYVRHLEASIRSQPANWLWSHRRWKRSHLANSASNGS